MDKYEMRDMVTNYLGDTLEYLWGDGLNLIIDYYYDLGYTVEQIAEQCYLEDYSIRMDCAGEDY